SLFSFRYCAVRIIPWIPMLVLLDARGTTIVAAVYDENGHPMSSRASKRVIYAALLGNLLVALTKFVAAAFTGRSAMASEAVHSLIDTGNEVLLLYGLRRAALPPDEQHPLGHGRELYFWSFIVTILIFALGAGVSLYQGIRHVAAPEPMSYVF